MRDTDDTNDSDRTGALGDSGEASAVELLVEGMGHDVVAQHYPGAKPQGLDAVSLDPDGRLITTEVKTTAADVWRPPHTTENVADHQMDRVWTSRGLAEEGVEAPAIGDVFGDDDDQVGRQLVQIDVPSSSASVWEVADDGRVVGSTPLEMWNLDDFRDD